MRDFVHALRTMLVGGFYAVYTLVGALIGFPYTFLTGRIEFLWWIGTRGAMAGVRLGGVKVKYLGRERLDPNGTYIFMCNHVSNIDPPIVVPAVPRRTSVLVKKELFRIPVFSKAMRMASLVPVDRRNREAAVDSIRRAAEVLRTGVNMTVFPEGTRSRDGSLLPFKKGPFHLAMETGVPVVPMTIVGSREVMPKGTLIMRPGTVTVYFHEPLRPAEFPSREALMDEVRASIASVL